MFVRFRKLSNGGFRPQYAAEGATKIQCRKFTGYDCGRGPCQGKPRCRWALYAGKLRLEPYRLKVMLVTNTRANGKVKQELVAILGSIDATLLDYFFKDIPAEVAASLHCADWRYRSLSARTAFWQGVLERMRQIGDNRLSGEERKAIRRAIHQVVPWVMENERKELAMLEAKKKFKSIQSTHAFYEGRVKRNEDTIVHYLSKLEHYTTELAEDRQKSAEIAEQMFHAGKRIAELSK